MTRFSKIAIALVLAGFVCALTYHLRFSIFDHDEIEHLHTSWMIGQGMRLYVDFFKEQHPILWYCLAPLTWIINDPHNLVFAARVINLGMIAAVMSSTYFIARSLWSKRVALISVLLLISSYTYLRNSIEIRPDAWMNAFIFLGLGFWVAAMKQDRRILFFISGVLFGIAVAILQKAVVMAGLVGLSFFYLRVSIKSFFIFVAGVVIPIGALMLWIMNSGLWDEYIFWNYTFIRELYLKMAGSAYAFSFTKTLLRAFLHNPFLWIMGVVGIVYYIIKFKKYPIQSWIAITAFVYLTLWSQSNLPFAQYLIPVIPLMAILGAGVVSFLDSLDRHALWARDDKLIVLTFLMIVECSLILIFTKTNHDQLLVMNKVLNETTQNDTVFMQPPFNPIYRRDAGFYWHNQGMMLEVRDSLSSISGFPTGKDDLKRWSENLPKFIYDDPNTDYPMHPEFRNFLKFYEPTKIPNLYILSKS